MRIFSVDDMFKEMERVKVDLLELGLMHDKLRDIVKKASELEDGMGSVSCRIKELSEAANEIKYTIDNMDGAFEFILAISQLRTDFR